MKNFNLNHYNFNNVTNELINILHETIFYLKKSNDSIYSNESVEEIKNIIGELITKIRNNNDIDKNKLMLLFAQTGNLQNISINNGWKNEFLKIAKNMDKLLKNI